jgi:hypothetical protein
MIRALSRLPWPRARNKLTVKQVAALTAEGIHSDGGGMYLRVRGGSRRWLFIGRLVGKRIEVGIGPVEDVSLA